MPPGPYDLVYPLTQHDAVRYCSVCFKQYPQWSRCQDNEPWSLCLPCRRKPPKKRQRDEDEGNRFGSRRERNSHGRS